MLRTTLRLVTLAALCAGTVPRDAAAASGEALTPATFAAIKAKILPSAEDEAFLAIPWRAALWPALEEARAADLPVLLWVMNGHPLGCT